MRCYRYICHHLKVKVYWKFFFTKEVRQIKCVYHGIRVTADIIYHHRPGTGHTARHPDCLGGTVWSNFQKTNNTGTETLNTTKHHYKMGNIFCGRFNLFLIAEHKVSNIVKTNWNITNWPQTYSCVWILYPFFVLEWVLTQFLFFSLPWVLFYRKHTILC